MSSPAPGELAERAALFIEALFVPGFNLKYKRDSWHQRIAGSLLALVGNGTYMNNFWTTIGNTVYRPNAAQLRRDEWRVIWHEGRHGLQAKKLSTFLHSWLYLFPLSLIPLVALGAIFSLWWLVPTALLLAPLPAYYRMRAEVEGYRTSMVADIVATGVTDIIRYSKHFTGPNYYFMWPFKKDVMRRMHESVNYALGPVENMDTYDKALVAWARENGLARK